LASPTEDAVKISHVIEDSLAARAGLVAGERIVAVNDRKVRDFLDLHLWLGEEELDLEIEAANVFGDPRHVHILREYGSSLGVTIETPRIRRCANDCPFCFVDQLPEESRKSLRIRDDDYRFSFLDGHFVTLTNLKEWEFERIIEQELSPLYLSVHALDPVVREACLKSPRAGEIVARIEQLIKGGIELHTQVVAIPGLNDGPVLKETVFGLAEYFPGVLSCSVVPVGLTGHREGLPDVRTYTPEEAAAVVETVDGYSEILRDRLGDPFAHTADEFVILAGKPIPPAEYYGDFSQVENGVGLVRSLLMRFDAAMPRVEALRERGIQRILVATGESFGPILQAGVSGSLGHKLAGMPMEVVTVENRLFGRPTTVAGLLGGRDIRDALLPRAREGDLVLIPDEAVNPEGLFLDDLTLEDLRRELPGVVECSWSGLLQDEEEAA